MRYHFIPTRMDRVKKVDRGLCYWSVVENLPANAEDMGLIPDLGRSHMQWGN